MKYFCEIEENNCGDKYYYDDNGMRHRLTGPAIEWNDGDKWYYIDNTCYLKFYKNYNRLYIYTEILELNLEYEKYIKQNIKELILEYNPQIILSYFNKEQINNLPNFIKDLIIL